DEPHTQLMPQLTDFCFRRIHPVGQTTVRNAAPSQLTQGVVIQVRERFLFQSKLDANNSLDLSKKPARELRKVMDLFNRKALRKRVADIPDALRARLAELDL